MDYVKAWIVGQIAFVVGWIYGKAYFSQYHQEEQEEDS